MGPDASTLYQNNLTKTVERMRWMMDPHLPVPLCPQKYHQVVEMEPGKGKEKGENL